MRKISKIILAVFLAATLLTGCGIRFGVESRRNNNSGNSVNYNGESINKTESIEGIDKIDIEIEVSNVTIINYEGNDIEISGTLGSLSRGVTVSKNSNKLVITEKAKKAFNVNINTNNASNLEIKIPNSYNKDIEFSFGVGEYNIKDLKVNDIDIKGGVGELLIENISFNKLDLSSGVGSVNIYTNERTGEIDIKGGVGDVNISLGDINGNLKFEGGMGSANIKIPSDAPVNIKTESGLGNSNVRAKTSGENKYIFDITMGIGELNITN